MKLDRNIKGSLGRGKYALVNLRTGRAEHGQWGDDSDEGYFVPVDALTFGVVGEEDEFFVIKLKDKYAEGALHAYANAAQVDDPEWAEQVRGLARRAGTNSPWCKEPD